MNCSDTGKTIKLLRISMGYTQKQLADMMNISDKTVSKWERGLGCPDIDLLTRLSDILSVSIETLLEGNLISNSIKEINMKNNKYYICPECGNISICTGEADVACCGRKLDPCTPVKASDSEKLSAVISDGEWFVSGDNPMTKENYITFAVFASSEKMHFVKLYPEWNLQFRIPFTCHGTLFFCTNKGKILYQYL